MQSNRSYLARSGLQIGSQIVSLVIGFAALGIAARILEKNQFGAFAIICAVGLALSLLADFGLQDATVRCVAMESERQKELLATIGNFRLMVGLSLALPFCIAGWAATALGLWTLSAPMGVYIALCFCGEYFGGFTASALQSLRSYRLLALYTAGECIARLILTIAFVWHLHWGVPGLVIAVATPRVAACIALQMWLPTASLLLANDSRLRGVLQFGATLQVNSLVAFLYDKASVFLLAGLVGANSVALFELASKLPEKAKAVFGGYRQMFLPELCEATASRNTDRARALLDHSLRLVGFGTAALALLGILFGRTIMSVLFSKTYADAGLVLGLLMVALTLGFCNHLLATAIIARGHPKRVLVTTVVQAVVTVGLNSVLIKPFGATGAAFATLAGNAIVNPLIILFARDLFGISIAKSYTRSIGPLFLCLFVVSAFKGQVSVGMAGVIFSSFLLMCTLTGTIKCQDLSVIRNELWILASAGRSCIARGGE
jgi:O-antigen/teichoic acid export membrane protein